MIDKPLLSLETFQGFQGQRPTPFPIQHRLFAGICDEVGLGCQVGQQGGARQWLIPMLSVSPQAQVTSPDRLSTSQLLSRIQPPLGHPWSLRAWGVSALLTFACPGVHSSISLGLRGFPEPHMLLPQEAERCAVEGNSEMVLTEEKNFRLQRQ